MRNETDDEMTARDDAIINDDSDIVGPPKRLIGHPLDISITGRNLTKTTILLVNGAAIDSQDNNDNDTA